MVVSAGKGSGDVLSTRGGEAAREQAQDVRRMWDRKQFMTIQRVETIGHVFEVGWAFEQFEQTVLAVSRACHGLKRICTRLREGGCR